MPGRGSANAPTHSTPSVLHNLTPYVAAPITANGGAADADGSDTAFDVACSRITVYSDVDVYIAPTEALAEAAASGAAWGRMFLPSGVLKEYPWADPADGSATRGFWAQKIDADATVNVIGWTE